MISTLIALYTSNNANNYKDICLNLLSSSSLYVTDISYNVFLYVVGMDDDKHLTLHQKNSSTEEKLSNEQAGADKGLFG